MFALLFAEGRFLFSAAALTLILKSGSLSRYATANVFPYYLAAHLAAAGVVTTAALSLLPSHCPVVLPPFVCPAFVSNSYDASAIEMPRHLLRVVEAGIRALPDSLSAPRFRLPAGG